MDQSYGVFKGGEDGARGETGSYVLATTLLDMGLQHHAATDLRQGEGSSHTRRRMALVVGDGRLCRQTRKKTWQGLVRGMMSVSRK